MKRQSCGWTATVTGCPIVGRNKTSPIKTRITRLNPANQRSETDPDKDGITNLDEFLDGTNPTNIPTNEEDLRPRLRPRLTAYSDAGGSVAVSPMKLSYKLDDSVTLTATPFPPNVFVGWAGDLKGRDNPATVTMDRNKTVRARFASAAPLPLGLIALWRGETDASDLIGKHDGTFFNGIGWHGT